MQAKRLSMLARAREAAGRPTRWQRYGFIAVVFFACMAAAAVVTYASEALGLNRDLTGWLVSGAVIAVVALALTPRKLRWYGCMALVSFAYIAAGVVGTYAGAAHGFNRHLSILLSAGVFGVVVLIVLMIRARWNVR